MTLRRLLGALACALGLLTGMPVMAANLALQSGPVEPSQLQANINHLTQAINAGVSGVLYTALTPFSTAVGTSEQTAFTYTLPPGTIAIGQSARVTCFGTTGATANNKTRTLYFGANSLATAAEAANAQPWKLEYIVTRTATAGWTMVFDGLAGTGGVTPLSKVVTGSDADTGIVIKCTATDATSAAGDVVVQSMLVESIR